MKPVHQTSRLNCFAGALASILEIDPERIDSDILKMRESKVWEKPTNNMMPIQYLPWLEKYGLSFICTTPGCLETRWLDQFYIGVGMSPRDGSVMHAVVCRNGEIVWDPYKEVFPSPVKEILYCYFITALSPQGAFAPTEEEPCLIGEVKDGEQETLIQTESGENPLQDYLLPINSKYRGPRRKVLEKELQGFRERQGI